MKHIALILATLLTTTIASANPVGGPRRDSGFIRPDATDAYVVTCRADEVCDFQITGDGDGDIDCCLADESGNVVACDRSPQDGCRLSVTPRWTGPFRLAFGNAGSETSAYTFRAY
jgi:hypothetical protein